MKKAKGKPNQALHRAKLVILNLHSQIAGLNSQVAAVQSNLSYRDSQLKMSQDTVAAKDRELAYAKETIQVKDAGLAQREARISEVKAERDRILRLVDQFTSVQIITHGTNLNVATNANSQPSALRSTAVLNAVGMAPAADTVVAAAKAEEVRQVSEAYRRSIFTGAVRH